MRVAVPLASAIAVRFRSRCFSFVGACVSPEISPREMRGCSNFEILTASNLLLKARFPSPEVISGSHIEHKDGPVGVTAVAGLLDA
jgi:hypothetical protein